MFKTTFARRTISSRRIAAGSSNRQRHEQTTLPAGRPITRSCMTPIPEQRDCPMGGQADGDPAALYYPSPFGSLRVWPVAKAFTAPASLLCAAKL